MVAIEDSRGLSRRLELQLGLHPLILVRQPAQPPHGRRETVPAFALDIGLRWFPAPADWRIAPYVAEDQRTRRSKGTRTARR